MFFLIPGKEKIEYIPVKGTLLSAFPVATFIDFFLLGEDKLKKSDFRSFVNIGMGAHHTIAGFKWIDFFGLLLLVLIIFGVAVHAIMRIVVKR